MLWLICTALCRSVLFEPGTCVQQQPLITWRSHCNKELNMEGQKPVVEVSGKTNVSLFNQGINKPIGLVQTAGDQQGISQLYRQLGYQFILLEPSMRIASCKWLGLPIFSLENSILNFLNLISKIQLTSYIIDISWVFILSMKYCSLFTYIVHEFPQLG